jgi:DNA-binding MarR family transcriptional regulator
MTPQQTAILNHLRSDPRWHYGKDIASNCGLQRSCIYIHLASLEERGLIERTRESTVLRPGALPRAMYRARVRERV